MNSCLDTLYGNRETKDYFSAVIEKDSLSHAYVIEGPAGSGRHTLAVGIACELSPAAARKIRDGNCPDVSLISHEENRKTIGIEAVRTLKEASALAPNELEIKYFIIEEADTMTVQAQNAFLKLLEEPPRDMYMMLLCENSSALLPTVLSRAPLIRMQIFTEDELDRYLSANDKKAAELRRKDADAYNFALRSAAGSIGAAKKKLSAHLPAGDLDLYNKTCRYITLLASSDKAEFYIFSNILAAKREELADFFGELEKALRDLIYIKSMMTEGVSDNGSLRFMFYPGYDDAAEAASHFTSEALCNLTAAVIKTHVNLDSNVNLKTAVIIFTGRMWNGAHE